MSERHRCWDCKKWTDAGPCPGCGLIVCQLCAEREGEFCCDGIAKDAGAHDARKGVSK